MIKGHPKLCNCIFINNCKTMTYNFQIVYTTDSDQVMVTYYTITNISSFIVFNFTIYITSIFKKTKNQDDIIFSK